MKFANLIFNNFMDIVLTFKIANIECLLKKTLQIHVYLSCFSKASSFMKQDFKEMHLKTYFL